MSVIKVELSQKSVQSAINKLKRLKKNIDKATDDFHEQCAAEAERMMDIKLQSALSSIPKVQPSTISRENAKQGDTRVSIVSMRGQSAAFIEFGTGVVFNGGFGALPHTQSDPAYDNSWAYMGSWSETHVGYLTAEGGESWWYDGREYLGWKPFEPVEFGIQGVKTKCDSFAKDSFGSIK